jgi:hypothetical protein
MRHYDIKACANGWAALTGQPPRPIAMCPKREPLIELTLRMLQLYGGEVRVYDPHGTPEELYRAQAGAAPVRARYERMH